MDMIKEALNRLVYYKCIGEESIAFLQVIDSGITHIEAWQDAPTLTEWLNARNEGKRDLWLS